MAPSYKRSVSTTWEWRKVKIERAAGPDRESAVSGRRRRQGAAALDRRVRTVQVKWRGGSEAWFALNDGRGWIHVPGHRCLYDVMLELAGNLAEGQGGS